MCIAHFLLQILSVLAGRVHKGLGQKLISFINRGIVSAITLSLPSVPLALLDRPSSLLSALGHLFCQRHAQDPLDEYSTITRDPQAPNSVVRMLDNVFSDASTGTSFFYTNDLHVLIDVLVRELTDRDHEDKVLFFN